MFSQEPKRFAVDLLEFLTSQAQYLYSLMSMTSNAVQPQPQQPQQPMMGGGGMLKPTPVPPPGGVALLTPTPAPGAPPGATSASSTEKLAHSEMALEALANVIKHNNGKNNFKKWS